MTTDLIVKQDQEIEVRNFEKRIAEFLPGAKDVPQNIRLAMAQVALAHGLDPFLKEVWPIPQKNREKQIVGWDLMIGIAGWRAAAWRSNEYWGRRFEKCSAEERGWLGAGANDIAIKCIVMRRRTGQKPMEFDGYGLYKVGQEYSKMNPLQCARYRAERDAMKAAFPISLPVGVGAKVADEETGEIINGSHDGPRWDVISTEPAELQIEQHLNIADHPVTFTSEQEPNAPASDQEASRNEAPAHEQHKEPVKKCTIKTAAWAGMLTRLQAKTAYFNGKDGAVNGYHATGAAAKCGYSEVTDDNLEHVLNDLVQYAIEQTLEVPAQA